MIKNIIYDMGGVLIEWRPDKLVRRLGYEGEDARLLLREIFGDSEWVGLDRGRLREEEAMAVFRERLPERLHPAIERCVYWWRDPLWPIPGMADLVAELKGLGYGIYLLSNATSALHEYFPRIPGSEHFDGLIVSADHKLLKPEHELFEVLFRTYGLEGAECFFIDDNNANADASINLGMPAAVFDGDLPRLRRALQKAGVPVKSE